MSFTGFQNPDGTLQTTLQARVVTILQTGGRSLNGPQTEPLSQDLIDAAFGSTAQMIQTLQLGGKYSAVPGYDASILPSPGSGPVGVWRASQG